jgi:hypothetical protein
VRLEKFIGNVNFLGCLPNHDFKGVSPCLIPPPARVLSFPGCIGLLADRRWRQILTLGRRGPCNGVYSEREDSEELASPVVHVENMLVLRGQHMHRLSSPGNSLTLPSAFSRVIGVIYQAGT